MVCDYADTLTCLRSARYLQYAFDETKVKSQDTSTVISYVANTNPIGRHFAWNNLKEMWPDIMKKYVLCIWSFVIKEGQSARDVIL